jgi:hypothetical protein
LIAALLAAGCSFADAKVGARQGACDLTGTGNTQATPHGKSSYRAVAASTSAAPVCEGSNGNACDDCESAHCCASRSACYGDPVCACADLALDGCLDEADAAPAEEIAARESQCWNVFSAIGTVEQARVACRLAWCKVECASP